MRNFNLVKSLTRVVNIVPSLRGLGCSRFREKPTHGKRASLRLLILCLSIAVFGVDSAWGEYYVLENQGTTSVELMNGLSISSNKSYTLTGPGAQLSFKVEKVNDGMFGATGNITVKAGSTTIQTIKMSDLSKKNTWYEYSVDLTKYDNYKTNRSITFSASGTLAKYLQSAQVTMAQYLEEPSSTDEMAWGAGKVDDANVTKTITIAWCNVPALSYTVTGTGKGQVSVVIENNSEYGKYNTATVKVTYNRNAASTLDATLTISNTYNSNSYSKSIKLSGSTTQYGQSLSWDNESEIKLEMLKDETQEISATATSGLQVSYSSSDSDVISVDANGKLTAKSGGEAIITASQSGDYKYAKATPITKKISVPNKLTTTFSDASKTDLKVGEVATVTVENVGEGTPSLLKTDVDFYATVNIENSISITRLDNNTLSITPLRDGKLEVTLVQIQTATVTGASKTYTFNVSKNKTNLSLSTGSCTLDVDATQPVTVTTNNSDVAVDVTSSNPAVAEWDAINNHIVAKSAGTTTITFKQEASEKWTEATATIDVTVKLVDNTLAVAASSHEMTVNDTWSNILSGQNSNAELVVSNTNSDVATYDAASNTITAKKEGTATFTFSQAATAKFAATEKTVTVTVNKKSNTISVTLNGVATTSAQMYYSSGITAVVTSNNTNKPILYEQTEGSTIATYYQDQKAIYSMSAAGTAKWRFWQEADEVYGAAPEVVVTVNIIKPAHNVPFTYNSTLYNDGGFTVEKHAPRTITGSCVEFSNSALKFGDGAEGFNEKEKYVIIKFEGMPDKLTFSYSTFGEKIGDCSGTGFYVKESATSTFGDSKVWTAGVPTSGGDVSINLASTTRYLMICYAGNYGGQFANIQVSEKHYLEEAEPKTSQTNPYDFGAEALGSTDDTKSFNVNWANIAPVTVTSSDPTHFSVTPSGFAQYEKLGSQSIDVTYHRSKDIAKHSAIITISNGTGTGTYTQNIYVKGETTKKSLTFEWNNALSSTGYVMNVGETYPSADITYIAKLALEEENEKVTFTTSDDEVIAVSQDGKSIYAKSAGTSEITANYPGSDQYNTISSKQTFIVDNKIKQTITWGQNLMGLKWGDEPIALSATASSGGTITYSIKEGSAACVTLSGTNNATLNISNFVAGEAYIIATQAGGEINSQDYFPITMEKRVIVRDPASQCNDYALPDNSCSFAENMSNPVVYDLEGTPEATLNFSASHDKLNDIFEWAHEYQPLVIQQYAYIDNIWGWHTIFNEVVGKESFASYTATIAPSATQIRFYSTEAATHHVNNLSIKRAKFMTSSVESMTGTIDINTLYSKDIKINHSNIDVMSIEATGDFTEANLSTATLGAGCGSFGEDAFTFSFTPTQAKTYNGTIIISDGKAVETKVVIPIELTAQLISQTIIDFTSESQTVLTTDEIEFAGRVLTGNPVYYTSSDETVAKINGNKLQILKSGTVTITAHCDATGTYGAAPDIAKFITINQATPTIKTNPTAGVCYRPCTLNDVTLIGGVASVDGTFQWMNTSEEVKVGANNYNAKFIPQDQVKYAVVENIAISVTPSFKEQTITWNPAATYYGCETIVADAVASSDLAVTYSSDNSGVVSAEKVSNGGWAITIKSPGTATITVTQTGNETYSAAASVSKTITVKKCEPVTIEGTITAADVLVGTALSSSSLNLSGVKAYFTLNSQKIEVAGTFGWETPAKILDTYGTHQENVVFTPSNPTLYGSASQEVSITATVHQIKFIEPLPVYTIPSGQKLSTASLVYGSSPLQAVSAGDVLIEADKPVEALSIAWKNPDEIISSMENTVVKTMTFTPKESYYQPKDAQIVVQVIKWTPNLTWTVCPTTASTVEKIAFSASSTNTDSDAKITYSIISGGDCATINASTGEVTMLKAGTITVQASQAATTNFNAATSITTTCTISKAPTKITTEPQIDGDIVYGAQLTDLKLKEGIGAAHNTVNQQAVEGTFAITGGDISSAGEKTITVTFTPANTDMYASCTKDMIVTVQKAQPDAHAHASDIIYGAAVQTSTLTNEGSTEGTWSWTDEEKEKVLNVGTHEGLNVHFTPTDQANYNEKDGTVSLTVKKATATLTWTNAPTSADVKDKLTYTATSNHSESTITYSIISGADCATINANTGELTITKAGTITVQASQDASAHYEAATAITETTTLTGKFENIFSGNGDWNTPENWSLGAVPTEENPDVVVSGEMTISEPISVGGLTIEQNGKVNIINNGNLTVNGTSADRETYGNLFVRNGGNVTIGTEANVRVFDFVVESSIGTQNGSSQSGQVANGDKVLYTNGAYIDINMDPNGTMDDTQWYGFTVPFPVDVQNGVARKEGDTFRKCTYGTDYMIAEYDMNQRLNTGKGWKYIQSGQLQPGHFYYFTVNGEYNTYSFKAADNTITIHNKTQLVVNGTGANANWNAVGNKTLTYTSISGDNLPQYVQTYINGQSCYQVVCTQNAQFVVGCPFFFQATQVATVVLNKPDTETTAHYAPQHNAIKDNTPMCLRIAEDGKTFTDQMYFTASEDAQDYYQIGRDLVKAGVGTKSAQIWIDAYGQQLCVHDAALIGDNAVYNIGIYAPKNGDYEIGLAQTPTDGSLYLTQDGMIIWNLSKNDYPISLSKGTTHEYGLLFRRNQPNAPTDIESMSKEQTVDKFIYQEHLYILKNGHLYNAAGATVKQNIRK